MGEEFPFDELAKVNEFLIKGGDIPEESIRLINNSLRIKESPFSIVIEDDNTISFVDGKEPIKFGKNNILYGEYMKEKYEEFRKLTGDNIENEATSKQSEIANEIQTKLKLPDDIVSELQTKIRITTEAIVKLNQVSDVNVEPRAQQFVSTVSNEGLNSITPKGPAKPAIDAANGVLEISSKSIQDLFSEQAKTQAVLDSNIKKMNEVLDKLAKDAPTQQDKTWYENAKEKFADALKLGLVGLAGFFTYEALAAHAAARTGCFVAKTDQKTGDTTVCKISNLTCNQDAAAAGDLCNSFSPQCKGKDDKVFPEGCRPCYLGIGDACNTCGGGTDSPCSKYCDSKYLVTSMNGYNYDYKCVNCDVKCAFYDMWNKVTDILSKAADAFGSIWDLINSIFKYGIYFIIGFIVLYGLYWLITKFTGGKDNKESGTTVVLSSPPPAAPLSSSSSTSNLRLQIPPQLPNNNNNGIVPTLSTPVSSIYR